MAERCYGELLPDRRHWESIGFMADRADRTGTRGTLWPFETRVAILSVPILLVMLLITAAVLRRAATWPSPQWDGWALLAIVVISVSPLILLILDRLATTGGSIKVPGGFEVAFAAVTTAATSGTSTTISGNLGSPPGAAIVDSAGTSIFVALREAANNPIAVVDLVDGHAWWETRLLVLLSGASRLNRPRVIVFLATQATQPRRFLGWAPSSDLLHAQLAWASHEELAAYQSAQASAGQYALGIVGQNQVTQLPWPSPLSQPSPPAPDPPISRYELRPAAVYAPLPAPHDLMPEAFLLNALTIIEGQPGGPLHVTTTRLQEMFGSVLRITALDEKDTEKQKLERILTLTDDYLALTQLGTYVNLVPRDVAINAVLRSLITGA
jgi:hypothetical protein